MLDKTCDDAGSELTDHLVPVGQSEQKKLDLLCEALMASTIAPRRILLYGPDANIPERLGQPADAVWLPQAILKMSFSNALAAYLCEYDRQFSGSQPGYLSITTLAKVLEGVKNIPSLYVRRSELWDRYGRAR